MTALFLIAVAFSFLIGLAAGWFFVLPFNKLIVNTFPRAMIVSAVAMAPMWLGALAVGLIVKLTGLDRPSLGMAYLSGSAMWVVYERLSETSRQR